MSGSFRTPWVNPAGLFVGLGLALLGLSLWFPWLSASRTTRVEARANDIAEAILDACAGFTAPLDGAAVATIEARCYALAASRGQRVKDLVRVDQPPDGALLCLKNKHYTFQLSESPHGVDQRPGKDTAPSLEVTAWPLSPLGPGHCAFFYPDSAARAYTRNLRASYAGFGEGRPLPGHAHRRPGLGSRRLSPYPGADNERWLLF